MCYKTVYSCIYNNIGYFPTVNCKIVYPTNKNAVAFKVPISRYGGETGCTLLTLVFCFQDLVSLVVWLWTIRLFRECLIKKFCCTETAH